MLGVGIKGMSHAVLQGIHELGCDTARIDSPPNELMPSWKPCQLMKGMILLDCGMYRQSLMGRLV